MKIIIWILGLLMAAAMLMGLIIAAANRFQEPEIFEIVDLTGGISARDVEASDRLDILNWNIGYAGLGRESDFVKDLGKQMRPLSRELVEKNITGIVSHLRAEPAQVIFLQEAARPSWNTYGVDVLGKLETALSNYRLMFGADTLTRFVPPPFNIEVGNAIFSKVAVSSGERRALPLEPNFELGIFRRGYRMHIMRLEGPQHWVLVNIHVSAFDTEADNVREKQIAAVLAFAQTEFALGHHVVIGGDWNVRLAKTEFPHTTDQKFLFWLRDAREDLAPAGWKWAVDSTTPTVRTDQKPFVEGENYQTIIDGFLVSPNVAIESVANGNLKFEFSDHNPVRATFSAM